MLGLEFLEPFRAEVIGLFFSLLGSVLVQWFRPRVRLNYGRANNSINHVAVPSPDGDGGSTSTEIYTEKYFLQNVGKKPATEVEFILSDFPADINVWQPRDVQFKEISKGHCMLLIPKIAPGELVIINCVYINMRAAFIASVKCSEALGQEVPFQTIRSYPWWVNVVIFVLMIFGLAFVIGNVLTLLGVTS